MTFPPEDVSVIKATVRELKALHRGPGAVDVTREGGGAYYVVPHDFPVTQTEISWKNDVLPLVDKTDYVRDLRVLFLERGFRLEIELQSKSRSMVSTTPPLFEPEKGSIPSVFTNLVDAKTKGATNLGKDWGRDKLTLKRFAEETQNMNHGDALAFRLRKKEGGYDLICKGELQSISQSFLERCVFGHESSFCDLTMKLGNDSETRVLVYSVGETSLKSGSFRKRRDYPHRR